MQKGIFFYTTFIINPAYESMYVLPKRWFAYILLKKMRQDSEMA